MSSPIVVDVDKIINDFEPTSPLKIVLWNKIHSYKIYRRRHESVYSEERVNADDICIQFVNQPITEYAISNGVFTCIDYTNPETIENFDRIVEEIIRIYDYFSLYFKKTYIASLANNISLIECYKETLTIKNIFKYCGEQTNGWSVFNICHSLKNKHDNTIIKLFSDITSDVPTRVLNSYNDNRNKIYDVCDETAIKLFKTKEVAISIYDKESKNYYKEKTDVVYSNQFLFHWISKTGSVDELVVLDALQKSDIYNVFCTSLKTAYCLTNMRKDNLLNFLKRSR